MKPNIQLRCFNKPEMLPVALAASLLLKERLRRIARTPPANLFPE